MSTLAAIYLIFMGAVIGLVVLVQARRGTCDLFATRNFFLAGLIVFQLTGAAMSLLSGGVGYFRISNYDSTPAVYAFMATLFIVVFFIAYRLGWGAKGAARRVRLKPVMAGPVGLLTLASIFVVLGVFFRLALMTIPLVGAAADMLGSGLLAVSVGLVGWVWAPRLHNPVIGFVAVVIVIMALFGTLFYSFGRRDILGVLACGGWGAYHGYWKHLGFKPVMTRLGGAALAGLILLGAFTAAREGDFRDRTPMEMVASLRNADVRSGMMDLLTGQNAGLNSMWLIEQRMGTGEYDTLHSARVILTFPIPRMFYPEKPVALALSMPDEARIPEKPDHWNIGPGIIGHIANDNPYLALIPYAVLLGLFFRFLDDVVVWNYTNPFAVLPMGAALGQIIGIARGEFGLFFVLTIAYIASTFVSMLVVYQLLAMLGWTGQEEPEEWDETWEEDEAWIADEPRTS